MARTPTNDQSIDSLLEMEVDELIADSPAPEDDPLSLVRDPEPEPERTTGVEDDHREALQPGDIVRFHVISDSAYFFDRDLRRGEDIEVTVGVGKYVRTLDQHGHSWLEDIDDPEAQQRRWRTVHFAPGTAEEARRRALLDEIPVPEFVADEHIEDWKTAVLDAARLLAPKR